MSKDPAVLLYTSDFIVGTAFLTNEQVGKYIRLLCYQHQAGRMTKEQVLKVTLSWDEEIMTKFVCEEGKYFNKRMEEESEKRKSFCESRRRSRTLNVRQSHVRHTENENEDENTIPPSIDVVIKYCKERNKGVDPIKWHNFYAAKDWMIGKNKMKNWKAAVRTWEQKEGEVKVWPKHPKTCNECFGNGYIIAPGSGLRFACRNKYGQESKG